MERKGKKVKADIALHGNLISELRDVTCHMGSHSVTCHPTQVNTPRLTPAMQAGTRFTYPGGMEDWVDLVDLIAPRPGVKPATFDHESDAEPLRYQ